MVVPKRLATSSLELVVPLVAKLVLKGTLIGERERARSHAGSNYTPGTTLVTAILNF
jgi:hypothetical protein